MRLQIEFKIKNSKDVELLFEKLNKRGLKKFIKTTPKIILEDGEFKQW